MYVCMDIYTCIYISIYIYIYMYIYIHIYVYTYIHIYIYIYIPKAVIEEEEAWSVSNTWLWAPVSWCILVYLYAKESEEHFSPLRKKRKTECVCICICIYIHTYIYMYIYIHDYWLLSLDVFWYIYMPRNLKDICHP
jgi:hypothetical protein